MKKLLLGSLLMLASAAAFAGSCIVCSHCTFYPDGSYKCLDCKAVSICPED